MDSNFLNLGDDDRHSMHSISSNTTTNSKERDARFNNHTNNLLPFNLQIETPTSDDVFFDKKYNNNNNNNNTITNMQYFDI